MIGYVSGCTDVPNEVDGSLKLSKKKKEPHCSQLIMHKNHITEENYCYKNVSADDLQVLQS